MFKFTELRSIHLEISNNCQASCPMCVRNVHGGLVNPLIKIQNWTLDEFKIIMNQELLDQIESYYYCGNFGDPILNNDLIEMCRYTTQNAPQLKVTIHTNGGARNTEWWASLAQALPDDHMVVFALDGLSDTHSLYRIGTSFEKIIENAKAFIAAGGKANWTFIKFKHNEHQVEDARHMANSLGFSEFTIKNSSRFIDVPKYKVVNTKGLTTHYLEPSTDTEMKFISKEVIDNADKLTKESEIHCYADSVKEVFIDSYKNLMPCCWLATLPYNYIEPDDYAAPVRHKMLEEYYQLVEDLGGAINLNTVNKSIKDIVESNEYQTVWHKSWKEHKLMTCARFCGKFKETVISKPRDQFIDIIKLDK